MSRPEDGGPYSIYSTGVSPDGRTASFSVTHEPAQKPWVERLIRGKHSLQDTLVEQARAASTAGDFPTVIIASTKVLNLPFYEELGRFQDVDVSAALETVFPGSLESIKAEIEERIREYSDRTIEANQADMADLTGGVMKGSLGDFMAATTRWNQRAYVYARAFELDPDTASEISELALEAHEGLQGREKEAWTTAVSKFTNEDDFYAAAIATKELGDHFFAEGQVADARLHYKLSYSLAATAQKRPTDQVEDRLMSKQILKHQFAMLYKVADMYLDQEQFDYHDINSLKNLVEDLIAAGYPPAEYSFWGSDGSDVSHLEKIADVAQLVADHSPRLSKQKRAHNRIAYQARDAAQVHQSLHDGHIVMGAGPNKLEVTLSENSH